MICHKSNYLNECQRPVASRLSRHYSEVLQNRRYSSRHEKLLKGE